MAYVETIIAKDDWDIERRLNELGVERAKLIEIALLVLSERANITGLFPLTAAGTTAYNYGVYGLRKQFVGDHWAIDQRDNVETIRNDGLKIKIGFSNVTSACDINILPQCLSKKGAGSERAANLPLFDDLPHFTPEIPEQDFALYYLMVSIEGAVELSRPVVKAGEGFSSFIERIFIANNVLDDGCDIEVSKQDTIEEFEPIIERKKQ